MQNHVSTRQIKFLDKEQKGTYILNHGKWVFPINVLLGIPIFICFLNLPKNYGFHVKCEAFNIFCEFSIRM